MITAEQLGQLMAGIEPIGLDGDGATNRLPWTAADREASEWFYAEAQRCGLSVERDPAGSLWAVPDVPPPWIAVGSHLDSVRAGGRFDGALGVAAAFAVAATSSDPIAVISFADEEGSRFNTPTFGSRALGGSLNLADVLARRDGEGTTLSEAMADAGVDPEGLADAPTWLPKLACFLELHIDQKTELAQAGVPAAAVARLAARMRLQVELHGRADHAGTTAGGERRDALIAAARLIVAADELAASQRGLVFSAGRIEVEPNAATTVPERVRTWLDARAPLPDAVTEWRSGIDDQLASIGENTGVAVSSKMASWSPGTEFDRNLATSLAAALPAKAPPVLCYAGHDAGVLASSIPTGMVLIRNRSGVSHSAAEEVDLEDAAIGADAIRSVVDSIAGWKGDLHG